MWLQSIFEEDVPPYISLLSLAITLTIILASIIHYVLKSRSLPPGPVGLPYFGYYPFLNYKTTQLQLVEFKEKYGEVSSFTSCGQLFINLGTFKAMREAHVAKSEHFQRYETCSLIHYIFDEGIGLINGEASRSIRSFFLGVFKQRGMLAMRENMSETLYNTIRTTVDDLKTAKGKRVYIRELIALKCNTILRQILFPENTISDEDILEFNKLYSIMHEGMSRKNYLLVGSTARFLLPFKVRTRCTLKNFYMARQMLYKIIEYHKNTYNEENIRSVIDEYYEEKYKRESKGDATAKYFTDKTLMASLIQVVGDSTLTVAAFVTNVIKHVANFPEEQEKIYQELMEMIGEDRDPTIEDKSKLTYTNAYLMEVLRMSNFIPFLPSLQCTEETTVGGYRIPKGSITVMNFIAANFDPLVYEEPEKFNPSRFIVKEGERRPEMPAYFGVGKRSCLGSNFVMMQSFLFLTTIVKHFRLSKVEENFEASKENIRNKQYYVYCEPRKEKS